MAEQMEILLKTEQKPEVEEILQLISEMTQDEQEKMLTFMHGVRFAKDIGQKVG